jgi:hypothetical protein
MHLDCVDEKHSKVFSTAYRERGFNPSDRFARLWDDRDRRRSAIAVALVRDVVAPRLAATIAGARVRHLLL